MGIEVGNNQRGKMEEAVCARPRLDADSKITSFDLYLPILLLALFHGMDLSNADVRVNSLAVTSRGLLWLDVGPRVMMTGERTVREEIQG